MKNARKIVIFVLLWVLFVQNSFFGVVFAETNACSMPAEYNSCGNYPSEYSKKTNIYNPITDKEEACCGCETSSVNWACSKDWYVDNGDWCCKYACSCEARTSTD